MKSPEDIAMAAWRLELDARISQLSVEQRKAVDLVFPCGVTGEQHMKLALNQLAEMLANQ